MNEKTGTWTLSLLLALLLASVPAAAADLGPNQHPIPELKVNESIETIAISGELSVQPELGVTAEGAFGIPFGSIVVHTADRTTLVFDSDGNHLFSISDERSTKIPTPAGVEKPCTWVNQIPSGSRAHYCGNTTFVFGAVGEPILTVIDEHPKPVEDLISINITSPGEGEDIWIDAVPPHITVAGEVHAPLGVRSVSILSGTEEIRCGNGTTFACSVPVSAGENTITIQVRDNRRCLVEKTVNVTVHIGQPPPPSVTVSGVVTDREGSPVPGFGPAVGVLSLMGALLIFPGRKRR
ncbi:hypothetical protein [Methanoculleus sp. 7T]|uniref:hypothetical protein n=1 Tax=Methanoculleus sp. 7T TaxID=2937282 RepID=UPI0020C0DAF9|nr:hypothetical protein [Methanoculleus sp. 7T]MCK8518436.1 hypothetical protein [Methanoculleus sp. 7T]